MRMINLIQLRKITFNRNRIMLPQKARMLSAAPIAADNLAAGINFKFVRENHFLEALKRGSNDSLETLWTFGDKRQCGRDAYSATSSVAIIVIDAAFI